MGIVKLTLLLPFLIVTNSIIKSVKSVDICSKCQCSKPQNDIKIINCSNQNISINDLETIESTINEHNLAISFANTKIEHLKKFTKISSKYSLSLKNCSLREIESHIFQGSPNITHLDLSNNFLRYEEFSASIFQGPYNSENYDYINLTDLNLSYNFLTALDSNIFEHTPFLTHLDISSNPLTNLNDDFFEAIKPLRFLKSLTLQNNSLSGPVSLKKYHEDDVVLESMRFLDVSYNFFETVPSYLSAMFPKLEMLRIDGNFMEELDDESFLGFNHLKELHISHMPNLRKINHNTFTNLPQLKILYLNHNRNLMHINMYAFGELNGKNPPITELYINDNNLRELNKNLLTWKSLSIFDYNGNHWMCKCENVTSVHCDCESVEKRTIFMRDFEFKPIQPTRTWGAGRIILSIVVIGLCVVAGIFTWRILMKYRTIRTVNSAYPVFYTSVPAVH